MSRVRVFVLNLSVLLSVLWFASPVLAHSGHTVWGAWRFDWEVKDSAGLAIRNIYYANELVIYKASMPVIRVQYSGSCKGSPFADQISWGKLVKINNCGNKQVCQEAYTRDDGHNWLEIGVLAEIGKYRLYQAWYLSDDGRIEARLWSKGLHCPVDHNHHPYWRFDFDIKESDSDQVFAIDTLVQKYTNELDDLKQPSTFRVWFVRDNPTGHGVWIFPGPDGTADEFSNRDVSPRLYKDAEAGPWPFGARGDLGYNNQEDIQEKDIVFWYVAHLHHEAAGGGDQWHWVGPTLYIHRP